MNTASFPAQGRHRRPPGGHQIWPYITTKKATIYLTFWGKNVTVYVTETVARKASSSSQRSSYERLFALVVPLVVGEDVIHPPDTEAQSVDAEVHLVVEVVQADGHDVRVIRICIASLQTERLIHL